MKYHDFVRGWFVLAFVGLLWAPTISAAPLPNAWQITDDSLGGSLNYTANLTTNHSIAATNITGGFQFSINARFVADLGSKTMTMIYGLGARRFLIWFDLDGNGDLTAELEGGSTYTITSNGSGTALYHTHEIIYNPASATASYVVDGQVKTNGWTNSAVAFTAGQVYWGSGSSAGQGVMNFHTVAFSITGVGTVARHDAGTNGNPAIAPNPITHGWTLNQGAGTTATHVSPDTDMVVVTLPPDQLTSTGARLNGRCNAVGSPTLTWFEWGTDTNYGNVTAAQNVGSGFSVSNLNTVLGGLVGGPDYHYRAIASNAFGLVAGVNQVFNISFIQTSIPGLPGANNNSVAWGDFDNDGRLDFLLVGFATGEYVSQLWRNTGSGFTNVPIAGLPGVVESSVAWGDYDNDGHLDFLLTGQDQELNRISQLRRNTGSGFDDVTFSNLPGVFASSVGWSDFDNDGRLDFSLMGFNASGQRITQLWRNEVGGFESFDVPGLTQVGDGSMAWGDYDNDGRLDFLLTGSSSTRVSELWRNTGSGFSKVPIPGLPGVRGNSVAWGDYDNDGQLDFLISGQDSSGDWIAQLWRNTGSGFTNAPVFGLMGALKKDPAWGDYDNDGRLDFALGAELWRNTGNGFNKVLVSGLSEVGGQSVAWGDYDNDGRLDLLVGGSSFTGKVTQVWRNNLPLSNTPPAAPTGLSVSFAGPYVALTWNPANDVQTPSGGLSYNVRIGTAPGASDVMKPTSLSDGRRLLPQMGNAQHGLTAAFNAKPGQTYHWSVQAVDSAFAGSPFSAEHNFTVATYFALTDGTPVLGDSDGDRVVDQSELNTVLRNYWQTSPPNLESAVSPGNTQFQFGLTNLSGLNFRVRATTNVALPLTDWTDIGAASLRYEFTDPDATNHPARFYQLIWP